MKIYKRWGENLTDVKFNFKEEFPEMSISKIGLDKTCKPKLDSTGKRYLRRMYLIETKDSIMKNVNLFKEEKGWKDDIENHKKRLLFSIKDILILQCIKKNSMNILDIINKMRDIFHVKIGYSAIIPVLFSLKSMNFVNIKIDKGKKLYFLTNKGDVARKALIKDYSNTQRYILSSFE